MNTEQEMVFDNLISTMFPNRTSTQPSFRDYSNHDGQSWDDDVNVGMTFGHINKTSKIAKDGSVIINDVSGEVFYPATCNGEFFFVLPTFGNRKYIVSAAELVFKAFTDERYLKDIKKTPYTIVYKDGDKLNPSYDNLHIRFEKQ